MREYDHNKNWLRGGPHPLLINETDYMRRHDGCLWKPEVHNASCSSHDAKNPFFYLEPASTRHHRIQNGESRMSHTQVGSEFMLAEVDLPQKVFN